MCQIVCNTLLIENASEFQSFAKCLPEAFPIKPSDHSGVMQEFGRISVSLLYALYALLRIDEPEVLDDLEFAILCLGDVHVHSNVMLTRHHFSRAARPLRDLCVVQCSDNFVLL